MVRMKDLIYKKEINEKKDLLDFELSTTDIINQAYNEIKDFNAVATIHIEIYAKKCSKCGKPLKAEECYDYCGITHCWKCKLIEEEVDDECT